MNIRRRSLVTDADSDEGNTRSWTQEPELGSGRELGTPAHDSGTACPHWPRTARREPPPAAAEHARGGELATGSTRRRRHARAHLGGVADDLARVGEAEEETTGVGEESARGGAQRRWPDWKRPLQNCKMESIATRLRSVHTDARWPI